jgi:hypothetical protein
VQQVAHHAPVKVAVGVYFAFLRAGTRLAGRRIGFPGTVSLAPAVPQDFPRYDRFAPLNRLRNVLIRQAFRQSAGNVFPVLKGERLPLGGHYFSCLLGVLRNLAATGGGRQLMSDLSLK